MLVPLLMTAVGAAAVAGPASEATGSAPGAACCRVSICAVIVPGSSLGVTLFVHRRARLGPCDGTPRRQGAVETRSARNRRWAEAVASGTRDRVRGFDYFLSWYSGNLP